MYKNNKVYGFFIDPIMKKNNCIIKISGKINYEKTEIILTPRLEFLLRKNTIDLNKYICVYEFGTYNDENYLEISNKLYKHIEQKLNSINYKQYQQNFI